MASEKIMFCPRCKRPVGIGESFQTKKGDGANVPDSIAISCPRCGYMGKPAEVEIKLSAPKGGSSKK